jgi:hypothetical protein
MAYDETLRTISLDSDASIGFYTGVPGARGSLDPNGGMQYHFVDITGPHQAGLVTAVGGDSVGVLQNKPQYAGEAATVAIAGATLLVASGTLTAGDKVQATATGAGILATTGQVLGKVIIGAPSGALATVLLRVN